MNRFWFFFLFRKNRKTINLVSNISLTISAAQHCRCYSQSISVLSFSAVNILFRLIEAIVGQAEAVQENCSHKVRRKRIWIWKIVFFWFFFDRLWAHANRIKKTHQFLTVIDHAGNNQHHPIYLQINNKNHLILLHLIVIKPQKPVVSVGVAAVPVHGMFVQILSSRWLCRLIDEYTCCVALKFLTSPLSRLSTCVIRICTFLSLSLSVLL